MVIDMTAFDKAWGIVKAEPYHGSMKDIDMCEVCTGPLDPPLFKRKDGSIICSMCNDGD